jgi:hypothetical protein
MDIVSHRLTKYSQSARNHQGTFAPSRYVEGVGLGAADLRQACVSCRMAKPVGKPNPAARKSDSAGYRRNQLPGFGDGPFQVMFPDTWIAAHDPELP